MELQTKIITVLFFTFFHIFTFPREGFFFHPGKFIFSAGFEFSSSIVSFQFEGLCSIFYKTSLVVIYSFSFYLSDNVLTSPLFLKDSFARQRNLTCQFFSFSTLNIVSYCLCPAKFLMRYPLVISLGMVSRHSVHTKRSWMFGLIQAIQCGANRLMDILGKTRFQGPLGMD